MASISLCLIVRNEARFLAACLASAKEVASQVVVVDTGSTDDTRAIAKRAGAEVFDFVWCDDFAKARNFGIERAKGDWVLVLDADERLTSGAAASPKRFAETTAADAGLFGIHDAARLDASEKEIVSGSARIGERLLVPRLFRRVDGLAFEGAIHEDVSGWLARRGMKLAPVGADILHFGRVPAIAQARNKSERNVELIRKWADSDRLDFAALGYLACELYERGDREGAKRAADEGFRRLVAGKAPKHRAAIRLAVARSAILLDEGDARGVLATLDAAERVDGPHPDFGYLRGRAAETLALQSSGAARRRWLAASKDAYTSALALAGVDYAQRYVPGSSSWASATRLATVILMTGGGGAALPYFAQGGAEPQAAREAALGTAEALIAEGRAPEALAKIERLLGEEP
ncbi:MAG: glycosyltransferase family 2 protein, partial [Myxococcales bacterium]|nr:glycosyltransferase family 2 protein [Myxococcales bacterium]